MDVCDQILKNMYEGEEKRDASSKIRGFHYQDYIAIDELLKKQTEFVCLEYIEDVFSVTTDKEAYIIQSKYCPASDINMKEVVRDLYYNYLRMKLLSYRYEIIPVLIVHTSTPPVKPDLKKAKEFINKNLKAYNNMIDIKAWLICKNMSDIKTWLEADVYTLNKDESRTKLFEEFAHEDTISEFLTKFSIVYDKGTLIEYSKSITEKLVRECFYDNSSGDVEMRKNVLFGLAIQFVHKTYADESKCKTSTDHKCKRDDFLKYLSENIITETEMSITAYLRTVLIDYYDEIVVKNPEMTEKQLDILAKIYGFTEKWLCTLCETTEGQFKLINTVSIRRCEDLTDFTKKGVSHRGQIMHEHRDRIMQFLGYLWKIILNINQNAKEGTKPGMDYEGLDPASYIYEDNAVKADCIKFNFDEKPINTPTVVLSELPHSTEKDAIGYIFQRMRNEKVPPKQWCMCCYKTLSGRYSYDQKVTDIECNRRPNNSNNNVKNSIKINKIPQRSFKIECMECIEIGKGCWYKIENCEDTVFSEICNGGASI